MITQSPVLLILCTLVLYLLYGLIFACFLANEDEEVLALSLPISFAVFAFSTLPSLFLEIDYYPASHFVAAFLLIIFVLVQTLNTSPIAVISGRIKSLVQYFKRSSELLWAYALIFAHWLSHGILVPFYGLGSLPGDWFGHYRITHEFFNHSVQSFPMRLPLYQLSQIFFLSGLNHQAVFGENFYQFQLMELLMGFSILPVVILLLNRLFERRYSLVILVASTLLPYVLVQALYTWPKILASTYSLLGFYFYLNLKNHPTSRKDLWLCGIFSGLSILTHWLGVVYLLCLLLDAVWFNIRSVSIQNRLMISKPFKLVLIALLMLLPLYVWGSLRFGLWPTFLANWTILEKPEYSLFESFSIRLMNFCTTLFLPLSIMIGLFREFPKLGWSQLGGIDLAARGFSWHYGAIPGNLSLTATVFLVVKFWRHFKSLGARTVGSIFETIRKRYWQIAADASSLATYTVGGILLMILVQSYPHTYGVSLSGLLPSVLLLFGLILNLYFRSPNPKYVLCYLYLESLFILWSWQGMLHHLDLHYTIQPQTADPALLLLNEVIQYKRDLNLNFLANATRMSKSFVILLAVFSEIGLFAVLMREIKRLAKTC